MENTAHRTPNTEHRNAGSRSGSMFSVRGLIAVPKVALIFIVRIYQLVVSPAQSFLFGPAGGCRFTPTCSQYALDAVNEHGVITGGWLAAKRICRCHPFGGGGHDPVSNAAGRGPKTETQFIRANHI